MKKTTEKVCSRTGAVLAPVGGRGVVAEALPVLRAAAARLAAGRVEPPRAPVAVHWGRKKRVCNQRSM